MPRYNHALDVGFTVESDDFEGESLTSSLILEAMQARVDYLRKHPSEVKEATLPPWDTYEVKED